MHASLCNLQFRTNLDVWLDFMSTYLLAFGAKEVGVEICIMAIGEVKKKVTESRLFRGGNLVRACGLQERSS